MHSVLCVFTSLKAGQQYNCIVLQIRWHSSKNNETHIVAVTARTTQPLSKNYFSGKRPLTSLVFTSKPLILQNVLLFFVTI